REQRSVGVLVGVGLDDDAGSNRVHGEQFRRELQFAALQVRGDRRLARLEQAEQLGNLRWRVSDSFLPLRSACRVWGHGGPAALSACRRYKALLRQRRDEILQRLGMLDDAAPGALCARSVRK